MTLQSFWASIGWSSLPIVLADASLYTRVGWSGFHCMPPTIMPWGGVGHTILCQVIACIIIKQPALCRALGEVYWCCGTQFVHPSWPTSRQKAKLYPANTPPTSLTHRPLLSMIWRKMFWMCINDIPASTHSRPTCLISYHSMMLIFCSTIWWKLWRGGLYE